MLCSLLYHRQQGNFPRLELVLMKNEFVLDIEDMTSKKSVFGGTTPLGRPHHQPVRLQEQLSVWRKGSPNVTEVSDSRFVCKL